MYYLKHFIRRCFNSRNHGGGVESALLYLSKVVLWVAVEHHFANRDKWILRMWPDLGVKWNNEMTEHQANQSIYLTVRLKMFCSG